MEEDGRLPRQARTILCRMRDAFMCRWLRAYRILVEAVMHDQGTRTKAAAHRRRTTSACRSTPLLTGAHLMKRRSESVPTSKVRPPNSFSHAGLTVSRPAICWTADGTLTCKGALGDSCS